MSWIKRNLYFVVGGVIAVALLGMAGWYCYSKWQLNNRNLEALNKAYEEWESIVRMNPNPGNDEVDNIQRAREQEEGVRAMIGKVGRFLAPIPPVPIPAEGEVTKEEFANALRNTIDQLHRDAARSSVSIAQPGYKFSFKAQSLLYNFTPGSLPLLSAQLGEVKAICDVLFRAKINSLENLQRERVSLDDNNGPPQDYLEPTLVSVTNELAVLTPYVVTFQSFSGELAGVLAGFGNTPHGFIVKAINVEPAGATPAVTDPAGVLPPGSVPGMTPPGMYPTAYTGGAAAQPVVLARGGLPVVLDEKPLRVTIVLNVVKLLPPKN